MYKGIILLQLVFRWFEIGDFLYKKTKFTLFYFNFCLFYIF